MPTSVQSRGAPGGPASPQRRRGRPLQLPRDHSAFIDIRGDARARIAWLLAVSRVLGADGRFASRTSFAKALGTHDTAAELRRLSRCETGRQDVPLELVSRYEEVLGRPPGTLTSSVRAVSTFASVGRDRSDPGSPPEGDRSGLAWSRLDALLEKIEEGQHDGRDWLELSDSLTTMRWVYMRPRLWAELCSTLVSELARSVGTARTQRQLAARHLLHHPSARDHVIRAIGEWVVDPANQLLPSPFELFADLPDSRADLIVHQVLQSRPSALRRVALDVAARRLAVGLHQDPSRLRPVAHRLWYTVEGGADAAICDLIARLPRGDACSVVDDLASDRRRRRLTTAIESGEYGATEINRVVVRAVVRAVSAGAPLDFATDENEMLERLVYEALFHVHATKRHSAALLLGASPYGPALATICIELSNHEIEYVAVQAGKLLIALPLEFSADPTDRLVELSTTGSHATARRYLLFTLRRLPVAPEGAALDELISRSRDWDADTRRLALGTPGMHRTLYR